MKKIFLIVFTIALSVSNPLQGWSQKDSLVEKEIRDAEEQLKIIREREIQTQLRIELLKMQMCSTMLQTIGFPIVSGGSFPTISHHAMVLAYDESNEQAKWVMHVILPDILDGKVARTNDFRKDTLVKTGTAEKEDYWKSGYDRGHLAPSADFRWSPTALSESYFYSNMSPQKPELNREKWAEMEDLLREYVMNNGHKLFVVTGPVMKDSPGQIGNKNKVTIPGYFYKVAMDPASKVGIAFIMPNDRCPKSVLQYAVSIDSVEKFTGINFFPVLNTSEEKEIESKTDIEKWKIRREDGNADPINPESLPKGKFNTSQAKYHIGDKATVCGKVVSAKYNEKSGATFINLDRKFPDQIFTIQIWKDSRQNFSYHPEEELLNKTICATGKILENQGVPVMTIYNESAIEIEED